MKKILAIISTMLIVMCLSCNNKQTGASQEEQRVFLFDSICYGDSLAKLLNDGYQFYDMDDSVCLISTVSHGFYFNPSEMFSMFSLTTESNKVIGIGIMLADPAYNLAEGKCSSLAMNNFIEYTRNELVIRFGKCDSIAIDTTKTSEWARCAIWKRNGFQYKIDEHLTNKNGTNLFAFFYDASKIK